MAKKMFLFALSTAALYLLMRRRENDTVETGVEDDHKESQHDPSEKKQTDENGSTVQVDPSDTGFWLDLKNRELRVMPVNLYCFYCCSEGKLHPREHFTRYPCCAQLICLDCIRESDRLQFCGECLTKLDPEGKAMLWIRNLTASGHFCTGKAAHLRSHLLGRSLMYGYHTYLDELMSFPLYDRLPPITSLKLAILNAPAVQSGVNWLIRAAEHGELYAMIDLGDAYSTNYLNDPFQKDKEKAEYWFRRALGMGDFINPPAFTRYGLFLQSEHRLLEARNMFGYAASHGHTRGQYEYAVSLLRGLDGDSATSVDAACTNDEMNEAVESLCQASEQGFYIPSYILLAKTIIDISEKTYGTAQIVGRSPLPRAIQIIRLVKDGGPKSYGNSPDLQNQADTLLKRYSCCQVCNGCGAQGSKSNPLCACSGCGVVFYCSRICQKRDFRDGHKFDCCSREQLFDYHLVRAFLPWNITKEYSGKGSLPLLTTPCRRSLMQMVEDDTDEVYGDDELNYDEHVLTPLMLRMRQNLEIFLGRVFEKKCDQSTSDQGANYTSDVRNRNLKYQIDLFAKLPDVAPEFAEIMHKIREIGNTAVHRSPADPKISQEQCEDVVRMYRQQKGAYESKRLRQETAILKTSSTGGPRGPEGNTKSSDTQAATPVTWDCANMDIADETNSRPQEKASQPKRRRKKKGKKKKGNRKTR